MSVNDPFVVTEFARLLGGKNLVNFIADGNGEFTKALDMGLDLSVV
jgi:peroxiredoxin